VSENDQLASREAINSLGRRREFSLSEWETLEAELGPRADALLDELHEKLYRILRAGRGASWFD